MSSSYTIKVDNHYQLASQYYELQDGMAVGPAIDLLGKLEVMIMKLQTDQKQIAAELAVMRTRKMEKTVTFKELVTRKMINHQFLIMLLNYELITQEDL
jgi:hypothetical protein